MGYCMSQEDSDFFMGRENLTPAYQALKVALPRVASHGDYSRCTNLMHLMYDLRWSLEFNPEGDVIGICFDGEKFWDDNLVLEVLAPWIKTGSFIEMQGEDGGRWMWQFIKGRLHEVHATRTYNYCEGCRFQPKPGMCIEPLPPTCVKGSYWEPMLKHKPNAPQKAQATIHKTGFHS